MSKRIVPFLIATVVFLLLVFVTHRPETDLFEIPQVDYTMLMQADGTANVAETFTMRFKKPFRYVTWALDMPEGVTIENVRYEVLQGPPLLGGVQEKRIGPNSVDLLFQFSRSMEEYVQIPPEGLTVQLRVNYSVKNLLMQGEDFTQLLIKYLGQAPVPIKKLDVKMIFPPEFGEPKVYHHPWGLQVSSSKDGRIVNFVFRNVPPNTFVEGRYVFDRLTLVQSVRRQDVSLSEIVDYEKRYMLKNVLVVTLAASYTLFVILFPFYLYRKFGRESSIVYDAEYEREVPYRDSPDVVNGVVKRLCSVPDEHGLNSVLLDAVREKKARFVIGQNGEIVALELLSNDAVITKLFDRFIQDGRLYFDAFKKAVQKESNARKFLENYRRWQQDVLRQIKEKNLMDERGNKIAKSFALIFAILTPIIALLLSSNLGPAFKVIVDYVRTLMFLCISAGIAVFLMRKDVFSRWTQEGLLYYLRWKNFERFLLDFSALSSHPPASVAIWDEYIVYATALGIAKVVAENFKELNPPSESSVASVVVVQPKVLDVAPAMVRTASQTISRSSSSSGGFKGGSAGSGAGGSRIGAG
ncbi:MAG: hypothetical protein XD58_0480 [Thermotoga sp. 50_1627]|uniref:DUF2207 domain-containing protein n=1 Tax=Pseudothermotoga sp. TaxID=2033661 RepID=UPI00076C8AE6|nr:MAG: hypothetical protein XD45_0287 [Thermotoga sp. 50_64]KUK25612.1 MAG: hypothetical protein XD58_0480 [Thermotoga sp. 50_1627]MBC7116638.1 DUF2207 domain-containing protein [Pseudothermotoga sp.]HBT40312.1 DUF2207 domain-containing protein [Pseudothermotoga sp.]HCO98555.1 DUF2207 domain-containing protein [Pseudothermotoga sp.]